MSQADFQTSARAASISVAMSAIMNATPWKRADRLAELLARLGVGHGRVVRALGDAERERADADPPAVEDLQEHPEAVAALAEQVLGREAAAVERELAGRRRVEPELVLDANHAEARRVRRQDERGDLGGAVLARAGPGGDDVGPGLARRW